MARFARKQMADLRAMEEQAERQNIIDPREVTTEELLSGSGKHTHTLQDHLRHPFKGFGSADEARAAGRHLGMYLGQHHGHRYAAEFAGGCVEYVGGCGEDNYAGGALGDDEESGNVSMSGSYRGLGGATPSMGLSEVRGGGGIVGGASTRAIPSYSGPSALRMMKGMCAKNEQSFLGAERAEKAKTGGASSGAIRSYSGPSASRFLKGRCAQEISRLDAAERAEKAKKPTKADEDYAEAHDNDAMIGHNNKTGSGKPKRTNARAAVVKKVMAQKGLSMIEASKYVKQHNLY
jgi:hypothetical protein